MVYLMMQIFVNMPWLLHGTGGDPRGQGPWWLVPLQAPSTGLHPRRAHLWVCKRLGHSSLVHTCLHSGRSRVWSWSLPGHSMSAASQISVADRACFLLMSLWVGWVARLQAAGLWLAPGQFPVPFHRGPQLKGQWPSGTSSFHSNLAGA